MSQTCAFPFANAKRGLFRRESASVIDAQRNSTMVETAASCFHAIEEIMISRDSKCGVITVFP